MENLSGRKDWLAWVALVLAVVGALATALPVELSVLPPGLVIAGGALVIAAFLLVGVDYFRGAPAAVAPPAAAETAKERESIQARFAFVTQMGTLAAVQQAWVAAEGFFEEALALARRLGDPTTAAGVHNNYAILLKEMGRPTEAEGHYQEALRLRPEYPQAHYNYAILLKEMGRPTEAEGHYQEALRLRPEDPEAHNNYANLLKEMGRPTEAEGHYQEALRAFENSGDRRGVAIVQHNWGILAVTQRQWPLAKERLAGALGTFQELNLAQDAEKAQAVLETIEAEVWNADVEKFLRGATITMPAEPVLARSK